MPRLLAALVALALLASPGAAAAQSLKTNAPPGNSAIDEYLETVPAASGNARPRPPGASGGSSSSLTAAERARLEKLGPDGKTLAAAIDATSPARSTGSGSSAGAGSGSGSPGTGSVAAGEGRSPISQVLDVAAGRDGGGGMGVLLPAILLASLLGFITLAVMRRRSAS
jgi:hypothetical protein